MNKNVYMYVSFDDGKTEKLLADCSKQELIEMRAEIRTIQKNFINGFVLEKDEQHPQKIKGKKFNPFYDSKILIHYDNEIHKRFLVETYEDERNDLIKAISKELADVYGIGYQISRPVCLLC